MSAPALVVRPRRAPRPAPDLQSYLASSPRAADLLTEVAHDLRSPLGAILALAESLRDGGPGPVNDLQRRQLGLIYSAALSLCSTASDLTELARGNAPLCDREPAPLSLRDTLEAVRDMVMPMVEEKHLTLDLELPAGDLRRGHARALSRALLNLTTNALKFTERGGVTIAARAIRGDTIEFSVTDTGPGLDHDALRNLYEPMQRARLELRHHFSCSGLGLAITRRLVAAMGAELRVTSELGRGSRFWFELVLPPAGNAAD